ncbi:hypothetical protein F5Y17DRAFT_104241 [Xylariaceae sp. FL0594]|nr:hypothetical protein F5Y17DRAFT_104241 [Xylariaceae sp. FL0594]
MRHFPSVRLSPMAALATVVACMLSSAVGSPASPPVRRLPLGSRRLDGTSSVSRCGGIELVYLLSKLWVHLAPCGQEDIPRTTIGGRDTQTSPKLKKGLSDCDFYHKDETSAIR